MLDPSKKKTTVTKRRRVLPIATRASPKAQKPRPRRAGAAALRVSEEHYRRYFDLGLIGMALTSPSKGILEVNGEPCRILGYQEHELLHKTWAEITHPDDLTADVSQFNRVLSGEIDGY